MNLISNLLWRYTTTMFNNLIKFLNIVSSSQWTFDTFVRCIGYYIIFTSLLLFNIFCIFYIININSNNINICILKMLIYKIRCQFIILFYPIQKFTQCLLINLFIGTRICLFITIFIRITTTGFDNVISRYLFIITTRLKLLCCLYRAITIYHIV